MHDYSLQILVLTIVVIVGFWRCTNLLIQIRDKK